MSLRAVFLLVNPLYSAVITAIRRFVAVIMTQFWDGFGYMVGVEIELLQCQVSVW
jgi:hypothetical protein